MEEKNKQQVKQTELILGTTHIRIKRVKPTQNLCVLLLHKIQMFLLWEPLPILDGDSPDKLFWTLLREGYVPYEDCIFRYIDTLQAAGCSVKAEQPTMQTKDRFELILNVNREAKQVCQVRQSLSIQDNVATIRSSLKYY